MATSKSYRQNSLDARNLQNVEDNRFSGAKSRQDIVFVVAVSFRSAVGPQSWEKLNETFDTG